MQILWLIFVVKIIKKADFNIDIEVDSYLNTTRELAEHAHNNGYNGVIITDSLGMGAVANIYSSDELAVMAVQAGNDILLTPDNYISAVSGIENAVRNGRISEERIKKLEELDKKKDVEISLLKAERTEMEAELLKRNVNKK